MFEILFDQVSSTYTEHQYYYSYIDTYPGGDP